MVSPYRVAGSSRATPTEAPVSGQNSRALLRELLNMQDDAIDALVEGGVVAESPAVGVPPQEPPDINAVRQKLVVALARGLRPRSRPHARPAGGSAGRATGPGGGVVKVIDLDRGVAGAYCAQLLALAGCDVLRLDVDGRNEHVDRIAWDCVSRGA